MPARAARSKGVRPQPLALLITIGAIAAALPLAWLTVDSMAESAPAARGAELAFMQNCIECHGQTGAGVLAEDTLSCSAGRRDGGNQHYRGACGDYLAYFEVVRLKRNFQQRLTARAPNRLMQGERLARQYACFQCHGELGQGGSRNPGSLKGYIPGYFGADFDALTRRGHAESISAWIRLGVDPALIESGPAGHLARIFLDRQSVSMPRFESLPDGEIQLLTEYVSALRKFGAMGAGEMREYGRLTVAPSPIAIAGVQPAANQYLTNTAAINNHD